ncbi:cysteine desulfurase [Candidatus Saccharibacteria bacterium]|nr:cysteine desulfurase [Candidatus Saccharibacteria bacterium]
MIYLDHAAATPVSSKALEAMMPYFSHDFYNPSASYLPAKKVAADYETAKATIAHAIGAKSHDIVITAGATEANNLALTVVNQSWTGDAAWGTPNGALATMGENAAAGPAQHRILYLATEHDSVRRAAEHFGGESVQVDKNGRVDLADLTTKITDSTELISIALVNGEIGVIQPLAEVAALIREIRFDRLRRGVKTPLLLHSDASQALNLLDINVARLGVDLMTLNSAKVYGPKGVGALYVSHEVRLAPQIYGGGQEQGLRSGTENVPGVIGFAAAVQDAKEHLNSNRKKYAELKRILLANLQGYEQLATKHQLDNFVNLCYNGIDGERLVFLLEEQEIYVATGAACAASKGEKSHVLKALGLSDSEIAGSLRLTLGETNTKDQIVTAAKIINEVVAKEYERAQND